MVGQLIVEAIKTGAITLFGCAITKALGQKEISKIIAGAGMTLVGVNFLGIITPICNWIMKFAEVTGNTLKCLNEWGLAVDKFLHIGQ